MKLTRKDKLRMLDGQFNNIQQACDGLFEIAQAFRITGNHTVGDLIAANQGIIRINAKELLNALLE